MYQKVERLVYALENNSVLSSIKKGFILLIPILISGSLALLIRSFPLPQMQAFLTTFAGGFLDKLLLYIFDATIGFMSGYLVLSISYYYSSLFANQNLTLQIMAMVTSFACFVGSFGGVDGSLTVASFGSIGVFTAMVSAILATRLFFALSDHMSQSYRSYTAGSDMSYRLSIAAIMPLLICVMAFILANLLLTSMFGIDNFNDLISGALLGLFGHIQGELAAGTLFVFLLNFLWVLGVHGGNALDQVAQALLVPANTNPTAIISKSFLDNFVMMGGSGTTICLVVALLIASRYRDNRRLAKSAAPLVLFNVNEVVVFGLPIVLNPILLIPFIAVPLLSLMISYGATVLGLIPIVNTTVTWTTPIFFSGYVATGTLMGSLVQLVTLVVGTAVYLPFVRLSEKLQRGHESFMLAELTEHFKKDVTEGRDTDYLSRHDNLGVIAKTLVSRLRRDISDGIIPMYYQPQVNADGQVTGGEALLRWKYGGQAVYPPLLIALAQKDGCFDQLTWCIFDVVCRDMEFMRSHLPPGALISVNISGEQLGSTPFVRHVVAMAEQYGVKDLLSLEVTEESSVEHISTIGENIEWLRENQIFMAIDDFSMGQTSLNYLKNNSFRFVKLDGSLVRQVVRNPRCCDIISSVISLGENLGFTVIAEFVENEEIRDILLGLGCRSYQGYLYSPALPREEFAAYCDRMAAHKEI
ncbi:PTS sugar transporter subunit IIC/EAL domain-containing protein [Zongyangia hominis]|uniref:PTS sugar transporter subunit IIC/EAL domain-containing protein n=1 Tax=Zongyangia hominis TaxID=2763677 RepID=A0A926I5W2_9FIRM|nr:EAL domain-containing protein [Zongyangia hominis]MBC8569324.1 PTS sugar transporter subunit IIC/EAL domain-containing protein [Zongyangia hominis]